MSKANEIDLKLWTEKGTKVEIKGKITNAEIEAVLKVLCPEKPEDKPIMYFCRPRQSGKTVAQLQAILEQLPNGGNVRVTEAAWWESCRAWLKENRLSGRLSAGDCLELDRILTELGAGA